MIKDLDAGYPVFSLQKNSLLIEGRLFGAQKCFPVCAAPILRGRGLCRRTNVSKFLSLNENSDLRGKWPVARGPCHNEDLFSWEGPVWDSGNLKRLTGIIAKTLQRLSHGSPDLLEIRNRI